jgi:hypothetical protein
LSGFSENIGAFINRARMQYFNQIKIYQAIIILLAGIAFVSCKSNFAVLTIENSKPSTMELPTDIQSITLMNRSINSQFENYLEDSLQLYFYRKGFQLSKIVLDSVASDTTVRALADLLFDSGRYDVVVPLERNLRRYFFEPGNYGILAPVERELPKELSYEQLPDTLNPVLVKKICSDFNTDALMVMEKFYTKVMADYSHEKSGINDFYYASLDIKYYAYFRIYKPENKSFFQEIEVSDTINWESSDYTQTGLFRKLPSIKQALINGGIKVALEVDGKLSPTWTTEKRGYFLINTKNDHGQQLINENNYDEASKYWTELAQSKNKKIRSKAEFNLALMSELSGDIDRALEWGLKSFYSYYRYQTEIYLKKLKFRKEIQQKNQ